MCKNVIKCQFWKQKSREKVVDDGEVLSSVIDKMKSENRTIVTVNGCFDMFHVGHLHLLYNASKIGSLVVLINSDHSIKSYKDKSKPIITLTDRMEIITAISFVNLVVPFEENTPNNALKIIAPNFHVKAMENNYNDIEKEIAVVNGCGGKVLFIEKIGNISSSKIIDKAKSL